MSFEITVAQTPLRPSPGFERPVDSELLFGEQFTVHDIKDGWAKGQALRDGYAGYVEAAALKPAGRTPTHRVARLRTLVYAEADMKRPVICGLALNAKLRIGESRNGFVEIPDVGFVYEKHLAPIDSAEADWIKIAESFVGTPYLWGGRTSLGIDCSGLVQTSHEAAGRILPRDTNLQVGTGSPADFPARRGDLVFWRGHVGIMVDPVNLLHANAFHMAVVIESLADVVMRQERKNDPITALRR